MTFEGYRVAERDSLSKAAALFAAAPDLLEALREARFYVFAMTGDAPSSAPWNALLPRIDAAIAKATGGDA